MDVQARFPLSVIRLDSPPPDYPFAESSAAQILEVWRSGSGLYSNLEQQGCRSAR